MENNNSPKIAQVEAEEVDMESFNEVCEGIFSELVECWLEKNALKLFEETQTRLLNKNKKRKT